MKRVFKNATILEGEDLEATRGYLSVDGGYITEIGSGRCPYKHAIDLKKGIVFPAFTNAHVHLGDSIAQDLGAYEHIADRVGKKGLKFEILREKDERIRTAMRASLEEMLKLGVTTFCDFREGGTHGVRLLRRLVKHHEAVILGRPNGDLSAVLGEADGIGISGVADYPSRELHAIAKEVKKRGKLLAIHAGEVEDDIRDALKLEPNFIVHATNASRESLEACFEAKVPIVLCPRANAMLAIGIPELRDIFSNGLVALGTDNVMVNSLNMFREMEFTFKVLRGLSRDHEFQAKEILKAATLNGRRMLGLESNAIQEGARAIFIILRRRNYIYDSILAIIHRYEGCDIRGVLVGDKFFEG
ncbi:MAG: amidohydrolase family protein [Candidatus Hydrothermarchaeales archaeon]